MAKKKPDLHFKNLTLVLGYDWLHLIVVFMYSANHKASASNNYEQNLTNLQSLIHDE